MRAIARTVWTVMAVLAVVTIAGAGIARAGTPTWQIEQPPSTGGGQPGPLGAPGAMAFFAPNRGLLQVGGSGANPAGIWTYDGQSWTLLANVCGSDPVGAFGALAFVGKDDFWTVSDPAPTPTSSTTAQLPGNVPDYGTTLCHFQDGSVVASYAVPQTQPETYLPMHAAACLSATDCWFGGDSGTSGDGLFSGTFHLHWDGTNLSEVWSPQDRAVSSLTAYGGSITQTDFLGQQPFYKDAPAEGPEPADQDENPLQVQVLSGGQFADDPYLTPPSHIGTPFGTPPRPGGFDEVDVLASQASADGSELWIAGGAAGSGLDYGFNLIGGPFYSFHNPFLAVRQGDGALVPLTFSDADITQIKANNAVIPRFDSVAPIPGSPDEAWVGVAPQVRYGNGMTSLEFFASGDNPRLLEIQYDPSAPAGQPNATIVQDVTPAQGLGDTAKVQCPAANDCWAATTNGWLLHWTDGTQQPVDNDPDYDQLISVRPPDGRSPQPVDTGDPFDDSDLFEPRPLPPAVAPPAPPPPPAPAPKTKHIGVLIRDPRSRAVGQHEVEVSFELMRPARVGLEGFLHGRQVAHTAERKLIPGDQRLFLKVRKGWRPQRLKFLTKELALEAPTLATGARRSGSHRVAVTLKAPGTGRLTVSFRRNVDDRGTGAAVTRHATVGATHKLTTSVTLPEALAREALMVRFAVAASPHQSGVPGELMAQRLLGALPSPKHDARTTAGGSR